jgi:DNA repair protein RadD
MQYSLLEASAASAVPIGRYSQSSLFEQEVAAQDKQRPLRPRQQAGIKSLFEAIREGHKHLGFQAPPGFGKTRVAAELISMALRKGLRPLFTCPAISLIDQTCESFLLEGIHDIGVVQADHIRTNREATVQIASVQTLLRRSLPDVGLILVDEFHERFDGLDALLAGPWADKIVIGLSATPWSRGLGLHYSKLIIGATFRDMMADGLSREYTIYGPPKDIDREAIGIDKGEFAEKGAASAMSDATIVGDVLKEWKERSTGEKTFAFCVNRDHAKVQMEAFQDAGIPFGYIDANTPTGDHDNEKGTRKHIFKQMQAGDIAGIASVGCLIRGVDEVVYNILDLQPTRSEIRHVQKWGRMRTSDPNATYVGFDHAGNNSEKGLGLFWDIYHDTLDTRKPGDRAEAYKDDFKPAKPRKCQKCNTLVPPGARNCPTCSERMPLHSGVTVKDGRLVEIKPKPKPTREQQDWFRELCWIGKKSGFKEAWAAMNFKEKFGMMPFELADMKTRGKKPTDEVKLFVREKRKEYLAAKKKSDPVKMCSQCGAPNPGGRCGQPCM